MTALDKLNEIYSDINALEVAGSLMGWDRQVLMPPKGAAARTAHTTILSRMSHELWTSDETQRSLERAAQEVEPGSREAAAVRVYQKEVDRRTKLPVELVQRKASVSGESYEVWKRARIESDFAMMRPYYEELFDIAREQSHLMAPDAAHPYDPLIDMYEEGATFAEARAMFDEIQQPIMNLVQEIQSSGNEIDDSALIGDWDEEQLKDCAAAITSKIGFDYERGRLDLAPNAFCTNFSRGDVRMTSRPSNHIKGVISSSLHEMGHGVYEQGSPEDLDRTILKGGTSLAVHESQSRMWENIIGRSLPFWKHFLPVLKSKFSKLVSWSPEEYYRAINIVKPEFIRVGADELTYNLHILVRFEIEVELITKAIEVKDIPAAWNQKYKDYLGITPPNDGVGCLQDVHWSRGSAGYFPTYTMGNLISAQVWSALNRDIQNPDELMLAGNFAPILGWLQEKIYRQAKLYPPKQLVEQVTGARMNARDWLAYSEDKFRAVYGLS